MVRRVAYRYSVFVFRFQPEDAFGSGCGHDKWRPWGFEELWHLARRSIGLLSGHFNPIERYNRENTQKSPSWCVATENIGVREAIYKFLYPWAYEQSYK